MRLLGYPLDPPDAESNPRLVSHRRVQLIDLIVAGKLKVGDTLAFTYPGYSATATLLEDGRMEVNGIQYATPSAAAARVRGGAVNGWAYWTHTGADDVPISLWDLREQLTGLARLEGLGTEPS